MDISMPGINGIEATRRMRAIAPQVRVVGLSMHEEADMAASMLAAGAVRYVAKGGPCNELLSAIREAAPKAVAHV
jgi:two-component system NarL family response regulator